jgi:hypothetical protein
MEKEKNLIVLFGLFGHAQKSTLSILETDSPGLTVAACEEPVTTQTKTSSPSVIIPRVPCPAPKERYPLRSTDEIFANST